MWFSASRSIVFEHIHSHFFAFLDFRKYFERIGKEVLLPSKVMQMCWVLYLENYNNHKYFYFRIESEGSPPCRPPKPAKYRNFSDSTNHTPVRKKVNKPPMPLPQKADECSCKTHLLQQNDHFDNYDLPSINDIRSQVTKLQNIIFVYTIFYEHLYMFLL